MTHDTKEKTKIEERAAAAPPVHKISAGGIKVDIWSNPGPRGGKFKTVSFKRVYRKADGSWENSSNLRTNDLPKAIAALQAAYEWIVFNSKDDGSEIETGTVASGAAETPEAGAGTATA